MRSVLSLAVSWCLVMAAAADGPADNRPDNVRRIPPLPKNPAASDVKAELRGKAEALGKEIESLRADLKGQPQLLDLVPDVQIFYNAVRYAFLYDEIFDAKREVPIARKLLETGTQRVKELREGKAPWTTQTGPVVRGYVSRIDGSVQPYGIVVPRVYEPSGPRRRLDIWCHGRGETLSEINFLADRMANPGQFTPPGAFVLHPYGRYCNANKFAGEIDCFEAINHAKKYYPIDNDRIVMRGFSMGGAACWQFAVHYPDAWCAAAPGAGFAETAEFLDIFQKEKVQPTDYEKKLWHWYDCPDYAINLFNLPTVAYSGEYDRQKQAADVMEKALRAEGIDLVHIIGPKTGHSYHPEAKKAIDQRINAIAAVGRDPLPTKVKFQTYTLRYNRSFWIQIEGMEQHWERARVEAEIAGPNRVRLTTAGVTALAIVMPPGVAPFDVTRPVTVEINGAQVEARGPKSDRSWTLKLARRADGWRIVNEFGPELRKKHGLQGPIDDAFMDRFVMVRPTGKPMNAAVGKWAKAEMDHAITHWRHQFRGEAIVKDDTAITDADIASSNLVLWGDPTSNAVLGRLADKLPIQWGKDGVRVAKANFPADTHVPVMIYPNPLHGNRYIVVNSGFTYREYDYLNNARQVPKLPDYAILDVTSPATSRAPGKIVFAGFFDEFWQLPPAPK